MGNTPFHDAITNDEINLDERHVAPRPLEATVYAAPGFIEKVMNHTDRVAYSPNRPLAFVGAVGALAHFAGHGYRAANGTTPNLMIAGLAGSGVGKEMLRRTNRTLAAACGKAMTVREKFASGVAIEDTLQSYPVAMYQVDEIHKLMRELARGSTAADMKSVMLLELYSQADSWHVMRDKAKRPDAVGLGKIIVEPRLTVIGTGTYAFYEAINRSLLEDGLMGRFIVLEGDKLGDDNFADHTAPLPADVLAMLGTLGEADAKARGENGYTPLIVPESAEATARHQLAMRQYTELARRCEAEGESVPMALWARAKDKTAKLALVFALSRNPANPTIEEEDVTRAYVIVRHATLNLLFRAAEYVHDTSFQADCQKVMRVISRKDKGEGVTYRTISRFCHFKPEKLRSLLKCLADNEDVIVTAGACGADIYKMVA